MKGKDLILPGAAVVGGILLVNQLTKMLGGAVAGLNPIPAVGQALQDVGEAAQNFADDVAAGVDSTVKGAGAAIGSLGQPVANTLGGALNVGGLILGASGNLEITPLAGKPGDTVHLKATRLHVPKEPALHGIWPLRYGWKELKFAVNVASVYGQFEIDILINDTTSAGTYTIYIDQTPWGGPYYEKKFVVYNPGEAPKSNWWNVLAIPQPWGLPPPF